MKWEDLFKYLLPIVMPFIVGLWKALVTKLPSWLYPILSGFLGMLIMLLQGLIREIPVGTADVIYGAISGLAGSGLYDIKKNLEA